jgi:hypothetical protein
MLLQTLCRLYIINSGQGFKMLWGTIKSFLDPQTASKIHVSIIAVNIVLLISLCGLWTTFCSLIKHVSKFFIYVMITHLSFSSRFLEASTRISCLKLLMRGQYQTFIKFIHLNILILRSRILVFSFRLIFLVSCQ